MNSENKELTGRISGFDLARAFAIFGMILVHFRLATGPENSSSWLSQLVSQFEGRAAATFVLLAGVGITLMSQKARLSHNRQIIRKNKISLFKRSVLLIITGLCYAPIWQADILHVYGFYIAVGTLFITCSNRALWIAAGIFTLIFPIMLLFLNYETGWNWETLYYTDFWTIRGMIRHIFFNGFNPVFPWTAFLLVGMWLGRQDLRTPKVRKLLMISSLSVLLATEFCSFLILNNITKFSIEVPLDVLVSVMGTKPMPPMPQFVIAGSSFAILIVTICVTISSNWPNSRFLVPLYHTGQLSLTIYVAHVIFGLGFLEEMGWLSNQSIEFAVSSALIFIVLSIIFSHLWRLRFSKGPLEAVFRYLIA